jgi:hypothetical protein
MNSPFYTKRKGTIRGVPFVDSPDDNMVIPTWRWKSVCDELAKQRGRATTWMAISAFLAALLLVLLVNR